MKSTILLTLGLAFALPLHAEEAAAPAKPKMSPEESFKKKDIDKDGFLSLEEFVGKMTGEKKTKAEESFARRDKDKDGKLTLAEFTLAPKGAKTAKDDEKAPE